VRAALRGRACGGSSTCWGLLRWARGSTHQQPVPAEAPALCRSLYHPLPFRHSIVFAALTVAVGTPLQRPRTLRRCLAAAACCCWGGCTPGQQRAAGGPLAAGAPGRSPAARPPPRHPPHPRSHPPALRRSTRTTAWGASCARWTPTRSGRWWSPPA
jgi:hypothetical protein